MKPRGAGRNEDRTSPVSKPGLGLSGHNVRLAPDRTTNEVGPAGRESVPMDARHQEIARCLFRESNDALFIFDPNDHRVVDANPAALRLTGFDKDAVRTFHLAELFTSAEPEGIARLAEAYRRTGYFHSRDGYWLGCESGQAIPVNVSVSRMHTVPEPLGLVVARDISDRVRDLEALRHSEDRYRGLVEAAKVVIFGVAADGTIRSLNRAFEEISGWSRRDWEGRRFTDLIFPADRSLAEEMFSQTKRGEAHPPFEIRLVAASGEILLSEVLYAALQDEGGELIVTGAARDVTAKKRAEEAHERSEALRREKEAAEAADRAKSEFLGNISHEIRTPMTSILGFTELLLADDRVRTLPADLQDHIRTIQQNGSHLLDLINDILDLTRIEVGKLRIESAPCVPSAVTEAVAGSMRPRAEAKGLSLTVEVDPGVPKRIVTDPVRLRQILTNLVSNAVKFTEKGAVRIRMSASNISPADAPAVRFDVIDTGVGMTEEQMGQLFELFYTSDHGTTRDSGAGLGLAISRRLAEMLGGRIEVRSRHGEGSVFSLTLPAAEDTAEPEAEGVRRGRSTQSSRHTASFPPEPPVQSRIVGRVLLAEDNESIRRYMAYRLRHSGADVVLAENGREAVEKALAARAEGTPFDWILMDVQMPILDGYEATRQLRREGYDRPIIALTAYTVGENREDCLRFGCDDHVGKPIDWDHLVAVLESHRRPSEQDVAPAQRSGRD